MVSSHRAASWLTACLARAIDCPGAADRCSLEGDPPLLVALKRAARRARAAIPGARLRTGTRDHQGGPAGVRLLRDRVRQREGDGPRRGEDDPRPGLVLR